MPFPWTKKKKTPQENTKSPALLIPQLKIEKSLSHEEINKAKSELRVSSVERDILTDALTRLYEAAAEGKITPEERDRLAAKYKEQISRLDSSIDRDQKVIGLYELEEARIELMKMFQDKFSELNVKIEEIRRGLGIVPKEVAELKLPIPSIPEKEVKVPTPEKPAVAAPSPPPKKTKADEILEKLREDLQRELEKLEQIEIEA
jgi:hypothetical protein